MKERPILFSAPMVRALLDGSKTQTRRVVKPQPESDDAKSAIWVDIENRHQWAWAAEDEDVLPNEPQFFCPYGQSGDRLWVREAWQKAGGNTGYWYRATDDKADDGESPVSRWKPSIHMPRWASRISLEITSVRVERLHDISEVDAVAEGVKNSLNLPGGREATENYAHLWWSINGDGSWEENPWVWAIEFKRINQATA